MKKEELTKEFLQEHYINQNKTKRQLVQETGIKAGQFDKRLKEFGLTKQTKSRIKITKEMLYEDYVVNKMSATEIVKKYGLKSRGNICNKLAKYGLTRDALRDAERDLPKEKFYNEYFNNNKSFKELAKANNLSKTSVKRLFKKYKFSNQRTHTASKTLVRLWTNKSRKFKGITNTYWKQITRSAVDRDMEISITPEYIWWLYKKQNMRCALTGDKIFFKKVGDSYGEYSCNTVSLDRIDSNKGYVVGNVQWIHKDLQPVKWNYSVEKCVGICSKVYKHEQRKKKWKSRT